MPLLTRKPLFLQGTVAAPVKTPAEDWRLTLGGLWHPDGVDPLKVRGGIVAGPGTAGAVPGNVTSPAAGSLQVQPCRIVMPGLAANQGAYAGALEASVTRTAAAATSGPGLPAAGNFKAGYLIAHLYDQLYGDAQDGWDVEVWMGATAATAASAPLPALPTTGAYAILRQFTVDSAGNFTFVGRQQFTAVRGEPIPCWSDSRPPLASRWGGQVIYELDTQLERRWDGNGWEVIRWHGDARDVNNLPGMGLRWNGAVIPSSATETLFSGWNNVFIPTSPGMAELTTYVNAPGQAMRFNAKGKVRVTAYASSDLGVNGSSRMRVVTPQVGLIGGPVDRRQRTGAAAYLFCGFLEQWLDFELDVRPNDVLGYGITATTSNGANTTFDSYLQAHYI